MLYRPVSRGAQMGILTSKRSKRMKFLGSATSEALMSLFKALACQKLGVSLPELVAQGLRNAVYDALALGLAEKTDDNRVYLLARQTNSNGFEVVAKRAVLKAEAVRIVADALEEDPDISNATLGERLKAALHTNWKPASSRRYANGVKGYYMWATSEPAEV